VAVAVAVRDGVGGRRFHVDQAPEDRRYACKGRRYGRFEHVSTLPDAVDADGAVASLTDGVFFVDFPKGPEARPKKIGLKTD
jgi:HSP20 family molecular chaperone IbpA